MDGARFANAVAALGVSPRALTRDVGVDVLCLGGTKNGMAVGEAVVFFDRALAAEFEYRCKQAGQLASKMRFLAAPWVGMLRDGAWLRHAARANAMAALLARALEGAPGVKLLQPVQANAVFAALPAGAADALRARGWRFYDFIGSGGARFMCAWDTTPEDVQAFAAEVREAAARAAPAPRPWPGGRVGPRAPPPAPGPRGRAPPGPAPPTPARPAPPRAPRARTAGPGQARARPARAAASRSGPTPPGRRGRRGPAPWRPWPPAPGSPRGPRAPRACARGPG
jgi:hypothetical protein